MSAVFRVLLSMEVRAEQSAEFERTWTAIATSVAEHPANLSQALMRGRDGDGRYHILSDWTDEDAFRRFEHSDAHVEFRARLAPYRTGVTMSTMHVVREFDRGGPA